MSDRVRLIIKDSEGQLISGACLYMVHPLYRRDDNGVLEACNDPLIDSTVSNPIVADVFGATSEFLITINDSK